MVLFQLSHAAGKPTCAAINYCQVEKKNFKMGWRTVYSKELKFDKFCDSDRPYLSLEKDLGIELWLFPGEPSETIAFKQKPYITIGIHTYKLTYVVAAAAAPVATPVVHFNYRLPEKTSDIIEVTCMKK